MLTSLLQRLKAPVVGCALVSGYLWTGAASKLWIAERTPRQAYFGENSLHQPPMRGYPRASVNIPFMRSLQGYGWLASGPLLGPTTGDFLKGLGVGIDTESPDYEARCRAALERVAEQSRFNPWREHARVELAHLLARPSSISPRKVTWDDEDFEGPSWITLGLVDAERWWMIHEVAGPDPVRAQELCSAVQLGRPGELVLGEALRLKADLAGEYWDFAAQDALLRDLVESCPASPLAQQALSDLALRLPMQGRAADAAGLARRLLSQLTPAQRVRLAPAIAPLQAASEGVPAAHATLESALREAELLARDMGGRRLSMSDPRTPIQEALKQLPKNAAAPSGPPPVASGVPVRSRLLAGGKALSGISVGLVPLPVLAQGLPPTLAAALSTPRAAGSFGEPETDTRGRRRGDQNQAWQMTGIVTALRQNPALVARSDGEGNLLWPSVPPGAYGVVLRVGTWQLPNAGRDLTVTPLPAPISVNGPGTVIPELHLRPTFNLSTIAGDERPPGLRWKPVPGAATYRVSLLTHRLRWGNSGLQVRCVAAPGLSPEVVWWRDGVKGTSLRLTPEHFAGPQGDGVRGGLQASVSYRWSVEARDAAGKVIATGETLAPAPRVKLPTWRALLPRATDASAKRADAAQRSYPVVAPVSLRASFRRDQSQFSSPFLDSLLQDEAAPAVMTAKPALYPTVVSRGQGLPSRPALAMSPAAAPSVGMPAQPGSGGLVMTSGAMPSGARLPFPGQMPPGAAPASPPGFAGTAPVLPSLPPRAAIGSFGALPVPRSGVVPRPAASEASRPLEVTVEAFDTGSRDRWTSTGELVAGPSSTGLAIPAPLVLTPRDTPLPFPAGPGRLGLRVSSLQAEVAVVMLDGQGKSTRLKLRGEPGTRAFQAALPAGEWNLQSLEIRPTTGEIVVESLFVEIPVASGLYARAWKEGAATWVEMTNLGSAPQPVSVEEGGVASTLDLAPRGKARLPLTVSEAATVTVRFSGKKLEVPIRGAHGGPPP